MDALCEPLAKGPVSKALHVITALFPDARTAVVRRDRGTPTVMLGFDDVAALRRARMYAWKRGWDPAYPGSRGPHRVLKEEKLDSLTITGVMAASEKGAIATVYRKLRALYKGDGLCPHHSRIGATERPPGKWMVFVDAYGEQNASAIYDCLHGKVLASSDYAGILRSPAQVFGRGNLARCRVCSEMGHSTGSCSSPSLYLKCSNGLTPALCADMQEHLGASDVFPGANPARLGVREFGFAIFPLGFTDRTLSMAVAMYQCGILSHIPRVVTGGGARACGDCGMLDEDANQDGRRGAHSNKDSPMCPKHHHESASGSRARPPDDGHSGAGVAQFLLPDPRRAARPVDGALTQVAGPAKPRTASIPPVLARHGSTDAPPIRPTSSMAGWAAANTPGWNIDWQVCVRPPERGQSVAVCWLEEDGSLRWYRTENITQVKGRLRAEWDGWNPVDLRSDAQLRHDTQPPSSGQWCVIATASP